MERQALRACFREAGCDTSLAALAVLDAACGEDVTMAPALPRREACLVCKVAIGSLDDACENGHLIGSFTQNRCWVCFRPFHPMHAWHCETCGAGVCSAHDAKQLGILCDAAPVGVCGLCGSPCLPPHFMIRR